MAGRNYKTCEFRAIGGSADLNIEPGGLIMNGEQLRTLQRPLKEQYQKDAGSALRTLRAEGRLHPDSVSCIVATHAGPVTAGLHPATGGDGTEACSGDMLLEALVACAGVTFRAVATALGLPVRSGRVSAEGDLDFRGTLGVGGGQVPVGFQRIRLRFELETDAPQALVAKVVDLTERYCVVLQTLRHPPGIETTPVSTTAGET